MLTAQPISKTNIGQLSAFRAVFALTLEKRGKQPSAFENKMTVKDAT